MTCKHELWEMDTAINADGLCLICQAEAIPEMAAEIARLREAAQAVVDDYPSAAGTIPNIDGTPHEDGGYGSIKALRLALEQSTEATR